MLQCFSKSPPKKRSTTVLVSVNTEAPPPCLCGVKGYKVLAGFQWVMSEVETEMASRFLGTRNIIPLYLCGLPYREEQA